MFIGLAVRLVPSGMTFTEAGVRFRNDSDPYYHALRAQRTVEHWPHVPWTDPNMNFPYGAPIPWPPLFDFLIAALSRLFGATAADSETVAKVAAWLALLIGVALLPLVAWLGKRLFGGGLWLDAALLVALLPSNLRYGAVGEADQHGLELVIFSGILLAFVSSWRGEEEARRWRWKGPLILGVLLAAAFWNWLGSALYLAVLIGATGLWHVLSPASDRAARAMSRALFLGGSLATGLLALSMVLWAPPGALGRGTLNGLTGLHASMCAVTAVFGGVLFAASSRTTTRTRSRRVVEVVATGLLSLLPALAFPRLRGGMAQGLSALFRGDPWYRSITEFDSILLSGVRPLAADARALLAFMGLGLICMPLAIPFLLRHWHRSTADRPAVFFLFFWGSTFLVLTLYEMRFQLYLVVPMALWICFAFRRIGERAAQRWPTRSAQLRVGTPLLGALLVVSPALPAVVTGAYAMQPPGIESALIPALQWLRQIPSTDAARPSVMAEWSVGHAVQYFANKPVVVTPFGTALDEGRTTSDRRSGMEDWAAFLFASDSESAEAVLTRRHAGFVLLLNRPALLKGGLAFAPPGTEPQVDWTYNWLRGVTSTIRPSAFDLITSRLYYFDGMSHAGNKPALGAYRLLYEAPLTEEIGFGSASSFCKIFGVVSGAQITLRGANPSGEVTASARVMTNQNRRFEWVTRVPVDSAGRAELRLPYATGKNGLVLAGSYSISDGTHQGTLELEEKDILGGTMEIDLSR